MNDLIDQLLSVGNAGALGGGVWIATHVFKNIFGTKGNRVKIFALVASLVIGVGHAIFSSAEDLTWRQQGLLLIEGFLSSVKIAAFALGLHTLIKVPDTEKEAGRKTTPAPPAP